MLAQGVQPGRGAAAPRGAEARDAARPPAAPANVPPTSSDPLHSINTAVAGGVWWLLNKFAGDFLSWFSRFLYNIYCNWLIGGATGFWGNVKWFLVCMSPGEETSRYAYNNSHQIVNILLALLAYYGTHRFQRFWYRASSIAQAGASVIENDLRRRLDSIQGHLEQMAAQNQELRESFGESSRRVTPLRDSQEGGAPSLVRASQSSAEPQSSGGRDSLRRTNTGGEAVKM